jgi:hypothetical protein
MVTLDFPRRLIHNVMVGGSPQAVQQPPAIPPPAGGSKAASPYPGRTEQRLYWPPGRRGRAAAPSRRGRTRASDQDDHTELTPDEAARGGVGEGRAGCCEGGDCGNADSTEYSAGDFIPIRATRRAPPGHAHNSDARLQDRKPAWPRHHARESGWYRRRGTQRPTGAAGKPLPSVKSPTIRCASWPTSVSRSAARSGLRVLTMRSRPADSRDAAAARPSPSAEPANTQVYVEARVSQWRSWAGAVCARRAAAARAGRRRWFRPAAAGRPRESMRRRSGCCCPGRR